MEPEKTNQQSNIQICKFYVARKRRQCKFPTTKGSQYCHAHCSDLEGKVQCPYEKGMYIDANKLEKHLEHCPRIRDKKKQTESGWYEKGVNLQNTQKKVSISNHLSSLNEEDIDCVIKKIIKIFMKKFPEQPLSYLISTEEQKQQGKTNDHMQAHLLAEAAYNANLISENNIYLEFGAGKGILSYAIALKVKEVCKVFSKNVLLERQVRRNKFDRFLKNNPFFQRFKTDVSDFDVQKLPTIMANLAHEKESSISIEKTVAELTDLRIVGVCKHMCGAALDISLRALLKTKMNGCVLASCCHHLCSYETYLNNKFFEDENMNPEQIQILFKLSSWGTRSTKIEEKQINFQKLSEKRHKQMDQNEKIAIGRMCKRLADAGRAEILKGTVVRYCSDQITPENFVILCGD